MHARRVRNVQDVRGKLAQIFAHPGKRPQADRRDLGSPERGYVSSKLTDELTTVMMPHGNHQRKSARGSLRVSQKVSKTSQQPEKESELDPRQIVALGNLLRGATATEAARAAGVNRRTLWRWQRFDFQFLAKHQPPATRRDESHRATASLQQAVFHAIAGPRRSSALLSTASG
jgi:hypothetical protein